MFCCGLLHMIFRLYWHFSRCWLCPIDNSKQVYMGGLFQYAKVAIEQTALFSINSQFLALTLLLSRAKSHCSLHWRAACAGAALAESTFIRLIAECSKVPVQEGPRSLLGFENLARKKEEETGLVISKTSPVGFSPLNTSWFLQQL